MPHLEPYLTNDGRLIAKDGTLLVGEQKCSILQGTESTIQEGMTETLKPGSE